MNKHNKEKNTKHFTRFGERKWMTDQQANNQHERDKNMGAEKLLNKIFEGHKLSIEEEMNHDLDS